MGNNDQTRQGARWRQLACCAQPSARRLARCPSRTTAGTATEAGGARAGPDRGRVPALRRPRRPRRGGQPQRPLPALTAAIRPARPQLAGSGPSRLWGVVGAPRVAPSGFVHPRPTPQSAARPGRPPQPQSAPSVAPAAKPSSIPAAKAYDHPVDPYLGLPLALKEATRHGPSLGLQRHAPCRAQGLRRRQDRRPLKAESRYFSRLPAWIKAAKNRDEVLAAIGRLRRRARPGCPATKHREPAPR